uniref:Uncharacterized protein n=1 Tax=Pipistrellus kuhlii TaxID=59472 RepID=A0A7J7ZKE8_PIPKU|nr:hypothetical protein mPipKuh1_009427 [Pipistrellus kuhlii]
MYFFFFLELVILLVHSRLFSFMLLVFLTFLVILSCLVIFMNGERTVQPLVLRLLCLAGVSRMAALLEGLSVWSALRGAQAQTQLALWEREVPPGAKCCDVFSSWWSFQSACYPSLSAAVALRPILESIFRFSLQPALSHGQKRQPQTDQDVQTELAW